MGSARRPRKLRQAGGHERQGITLILFKNSLARHTSAGPSFIPKKIYVRMSVVSTLSVAPHTLLICRKSGIEATAPGAQILSGDKDRPAHCKVICGRHYTQQTGTMMPLRPSLPDSVAPTSSSRDGWANGFTSMACAGIDDRRSYMRIPSSYRTAGGR